MRRLRERGFALATVLLLLPVMALMAWTYLSVGTTTRAQALLQERNIRALHAAEAGLRKYLADGQSQAFEMNDCEVTVNISDAKIISSARPEGGTRSTTVFLEVERGFVMRRMTNEEG